MENVQPNMDEKINQAYIEFLSSWNWHLHASLTLLSSANAFAKCMAWLNKVKPILKDIKFAGIHFKINHNRDCHVHSLLTSSETYPRNLKELTDADIRRMLELWEYGGACISLCDKVGRYKLVRRKLNHFCTGKYIVGWNPRKLVSYIFNPSKNIDIRNPDNWDMKEYRPNLLEKLKTCTRNEKLNH